MKYKLAWSTMIITALLSINSNSLFASVYPDQTIDGIIDLFDVVSISKTAPTQTKDVINQYAGEIYPEIFIKKRPGEIKFFIKGFNQKSNRYLEYRLKHFIKPFDPTGKDESGNANVWRLIDVYEVEKKGSFEFVDLNGSSIITNGEWECAIIEQGMSDFMGGSIHGDEVLFDVDLFVDEEKIDLNKSENITGKSIKFIQKSNLYRTNTQEPIAVHNKEYNINAKGIELHQEIEWLQSINIVNSYLAMLPIKRKLNGNTGKQISDLAYRDDDYVVNDVSESGFTGGVNKRTRGIRKTNIWGKDSGISAMVEITDKNLDLPNEGNFIRNHPEYNKIYYDFSGKHLTKVGEKWTISSRYLLTTLN